MQDVWALLATGLAAGVLSSTVGVASLVSFPALVALGLPPVTANVTNTLGLVPGGLGGVVGYRDEVRAAPRVAARVLAVSALGAVGGAALLLGLPAGVFEGAVPWLILSACLLVAAQPSVSGWLRARAAKPRRREHLSPLTTLFATLTGAYGGYFGAGAGVMMAAVLGLGTDLPLRVVNGLKTVSLLAANVVAGVIFAVVADPRWDVVALLSVSSLVGGYAGARLGRRLPDSVFRGAVVVAGVVAAVALR